MHTCTCISLQNIFTSLPWRVFCLNPLSLWKFHLWFILFFKNLGFKDNPSAPPLEFSNNPPWSGYGDFWNHTMIDCMSYDVLKNDLLLISLYLFHCFTPEISSVKFLLMSYVSKPTCIPIGRVSILLNYFTFH